MRGGTLGLPDGSSIGTLAWRKWFKSVVAHTDLYGSDMDTNIEDDLQLHKNSAWSAILEWQATGSEIKSNAG